MCFQTEHFHFSVDDWLLHVAWDLVSFSALQVELKSWICKHFQYYKLNIIDEQQIDQESSLSPSKGFNLVIVQATKKNQKKQA